MDSMVSPQLAYAMLHEPLMPIVRHGSPIRFTDNAVFAFENGMGMRSEYREHPVLHEHTVYREHPVYRDEDLDVKLEVRKVFSPLPPGAFSAGLGLMRWGSPATKPPPKTPSAPSRTTDENVASPPKKKMRLDHTTSPDFHRSYSRIYELSMDMPEPPSVKRMLMQ